MNAALAERAGAITRYASVNFGVPRGFGHDVSQSHHNRGRHFRPCIRTNINRYVREQRAVVDRTRSTAEAALLHR